jgi:cell division protein FtsB
MDAALQKLIERRKKLQQAYDDLIAAPASYNIQGSVSAQNQKLSDLQAEIDKIDRQIAQLCGGDGITRSYPNYRH